MKDYQAHERLKDFIQKSAKDLKIYAQKPNANEAYIERKNEELESLSDLYQTLLDNSFSYPEYWEQVEPFIQESIKIVETSAVIIVIPVRERGIPAYFNFGTI